MNAATESALQLRDIHLPMSPGWWPPAPGWWLLAALAGAVVLWGIIVTARWWKKRRRTAAVFTELRRIIDDPARDDAQVAAAVSALLRRVALSCYADTEVAGLTGHAWLEFLDRHGGSEAFTTGVGRAIADAPFQRHAEVNRAELAQAAHSWIRKQWSAAAW